MTYDHYPRLARVGQDLYLVVGNYVSSSNTFAAILKIGPDGGVQASTQTVAASRASAPQVAVAAGADELAVVSRPDNPNASETADVYRVGANFLVGGEGTVTGTRAVAATYLPSTSTFVVEAMPPSIRYLPRSWIGS